MALTITDANFEETVLKSSQLVVVDFWATWCGPCRTAPIIEELATEYEGKVTVGKVDVDSSDDIPAKYGIRNIPTVLFFKNGALADRIVGAAAKSAFVEKINGLL